MRPTSLDEAIHQLAYRHGGMTALAHELGITRERLYAWRVSLDGPTRTRLAPAKMRLRGMLEQMDAEYEAAESGFGHE